MNNDDKILNELLEKFKVKLKNDKAYNGKFFKQMACADGFIQGFRQAEKYYEKRR